VAKDGIKEILQAFAGKRVFLTGHTGFKGTWMTILLKELGADVAGYALPPDTDRSHFDLLGLSSKIRHIVGDIRDKEHLHSAMQDFRPEYVFHLAAQALVRKSYSDPEYTFDTNVMGSVNLLEAVRACDSVRSLIYVTSDKCYENVEWIWGYRENDTLGGHDPYSASKAAAEVVFSAYRRSYFQHRANFGAASARAGNVIGGGDWSADRIVPDCMRAIEKNVTMQMRNPKATRPWQHVLEPISGYILLAGKLYQNPKDFGGSWNFGPSSSEIRTVAEVAQTLVKHMGHGQIAIHEPTPSQHEANLLQLNCDKAAQILGWRPRWNVDQTLAATAEWYKVYFEGHDVTSITRSQILRYFWELT
jgi:CDP-glucose 4,6-dehydratase